MTSLNPDRQSSSDPSSNKKGFSTKKILPHRHFNSDFTCGELNLHINTFNLQIVCIQVPHRLPHKDNDPEIISWDIGNNILFTSSAYKNDINAAVGGVGLRVLEHQSTTSSDFYQKSKQLYFDCNFQRQP